MGTVGTVEGTWRVIVRLTGGWSESSATSASRISAGERARETIVLLGPTTQSVGRGGDNCDGEEEGIGRSVGCGTVEMGEVRVEVDCGGGAGGALECGKACLM